MRCSGAAAVSDQPLPQVPLPNFGPSWDARSESTESAASRAETPTRRSEESLEALGSQAPTQRWPAHF